MSTSAIQLPPSSALIEVADVPHSPEYYSARRPGARSALYLHPAAAARLQAARRRLKELSTASAEYDLHVWDGFRTREVQQGIFDDYVEALVREKGLEPMMASTVALTFVSDPASVFPHGTGGTVDLTLTVNGSPAEMGTGFDDFTEMAHRNWYLQNSPSDERSWDAHRNRTLLYRVMRGAGFVGLEDEWWHFEWGTARWAASGGHEALLTAVLAYPPADEPAA